MAQKQDHVKAGIFVLTGIILTLIVIFTLADFKSLTQTTKPVHIFYQLSDGVQGLKPGAEITLGDQPIGTVQSIAPFYKEHSDGSSQIVGLNVTMLIPEEIKIFWDAQIELVVPPLGSGTRLNIASVGGSVGITSQKQRDQMEYAPDKIIPSTVIPDWSLALNQKRIDLKPNELLALYPGPQNAIPGAIASSPLIRDMALNMGIETKQRMEIQQIIENAAAISARIRYDLPQITGKANAIATQAQQSLTELNVSLKNIKVITTDLKDNSKQWNDRISNTIQRANNAVSKLDDLVNSQQQIVVDSLANVRQATADAKDLVAGLKNDTLIQLNTAMTHVQETMANLQTASSKVRDFAVGQKPILERTIANAQISAQQLKLATVEIRRSPWRLLHTPSEEELETDNLYDAARSFALAASALQAVSASLDSVANQKDTDPQQLKEMVEHLSTIFDKFKATEKIFWDTLGKYTNAKP